MESTCRAKSRSGAQCKARVVTDGLCAFHADPALAAKLGRKSGAARRGASTDLSLDVQPPTNASEVRELLGKTIAELLGRRLEPRMASAVAYLSGVFLKAVEVSSIEDRLTKLEEAAAPVAHPPAKYSDYPHASRSECEEE